MEISNSYNSGSFKDRAKMFAPNRGFLGLGIGNLIEICPTLTVVVTATN